MASSTSSDCRLRFSEREENKISDIANAMLLLSLLLKLFPSLSLARDRKNPWDYRCQVSKALAAASPSISLLWCEGPFCMDNKGRKDFYSFAFGRILVSQRASPLLFVMEKRNDFLSLFLACEIQDGVECWDS